MPFEMERSNKLFVVSSSYKFEETSVYEAVSVGWVKADMWGGKSREIIEHKVNWVSEI